MLQIASTANGNDIILDFFAGTGSLMDAVLNQNRGDNGNRRCILVQLPEPVAGMGGSISDIAKGRIRAAGAKIKSENPMFSGDIGFRVMKIDSSNMQDVYYTPDKVRQETLLDAVDNIKHDRVAEDLLFQVLLDWGVDIGLPIFRETISEKNVYFVNQDRPDLAACFDRGVTEALVKQIAARHPLRAVFRDSGFSSDSVKINVEQIFKLLSPATDVRVI